MPQTVNNAHRRTDSPVRSALEALASLRLTVVLFALAIFLIFAGTLAQKDHDIWYVVDEAYFRVWLASVEWQAFARLVEMFTKAEAQPVSGGFWFPGGKLIGVLMMANLLAAHAIRFTVTTSGDRLRRGLGIVAAGVVATVLVVRSGLDDAIESQLSPGFCEAVWQSLRASVVAAGLTAAWWVNRRRGTMRPAEWWLAASAAATLLGVGGWLLASPSTRIDDAGLRIVWQLAKGGAAGAILLTGCAIAFGKRAGIVLLHGGIGLLMVGELITDLTADEAQMRIDEGGTATYAYDIRKTELALTTPAADGMRVTVVPERMLAEHARSGAPIKHPDLPFDLRVVRFDVNSRLADPGDGVANPATAGAGLSRVSRPLPSVNGVGPDQSVNLPSAYVEPLDRESGASLGVWLTSASFLPTQGTGGLSLIEQPIEHSGETHGVELRFKRTYKPYTVTLTDFRFDRYVGTNVPKNFSSDVVLRDPSRGVEREVRIWMNNPLRYAGDTLYQSSFDDATETTTILQIVSNRGWMIPYVSCMLVGLGMLAHFGEGLSRFVGRRSREAAKAAPAADTGGGLDFRSPLVLAPALAAVLCGGYLLSKARPGDESVRGFDISRFARLPIAHGGRIKPVDTLARNTLQSLSARQEVETDGRAVSAAEWLLDVISSGPAARDHRVFRIENLEVVEMLGLPRRPGSYRYSHREVLGDAEQTAELEARFRRVRETPEAEWTLVDAKLNELDSKLNLHTMLAAAYSSPRISIDKERAPGEIRAAMREAAFLRGSPAPKAVPPDTEGGAWQTLFEAEFDDLVRYSRGVAPNDGTIALSGVIDAYAKNDPAAFNARLGKFEAAAAASETLFADSAEQAPAERLKLTRVRFEAFFNAFSPFYYCAATYVIGFLLCAASWLAPGVTGRALARGATAAIVATLLVHTFALVVRVYISERPPVTNLHSSAIFIGWAAVLFGVAMESIYRIGVGAAVASALGFSSLVVAHYLSLDGDTFTVLRAVLDTQFWLATHVVCITLGYAATYLAGFLAIAYLGATQGARLLHRPDLMSEDTGRQLVRMMYGTVCFGLFFSFIGTVLGGLWADDSWGRFWGWDPKENGALIIVLWNALVLHARWGKMVGPRGLSTLIVGGNIVTTWSWFGVNELGVGLHAYGANDSPTASYLLMFVVSQLVVIALGLLPLGRTPAASAAG